MITRQDEKMLRRMMAEAWPDEKRKDSLRVWWEGWKRAHDIHPAQLPDEKAMVLLRLAPIETLDLSTRPYCGLRRQGIHTVGALLQMREDEVQNLSSIGKKSWKEIEQVLSRCGWRLAPQKIISDFEKWLEG